MVFDRSEPGGGRKPVDDGHGAEVEEFFGDGGFLSGD